MRKRRKNNNQIREKEQTQCYQQQWAKTNIGGSKIRGTKERKA